MRSISVTTTALLIALAAVPAARGDPADTCREGRACWHYLRAPVPIPDDTCACARCEAGPRHSGNDPWPEGWRTVRFAGGEVRLQAFLRRHAASWGLACSVCDATRLPGIPDPELYPFTKDAPHKWNEAALREVREQVAVEKDLLGYEPVVIQGPHFYLVIDIPELRINGRSRKTHELAHIFMQRLERAYGEFCEGIGKPLLRRPIGVYMPESAVVARALQAEYFGHPDTTILYGGGATTISGGHCMSGFTVSLSRQIPPQSPDGRVREVLRGAKGRKPGTGGAVAPLHEDDQVHCRLRHLLGHALMAAWPYPRTKPSALPPWIYVGAGHWLSKRLPRLRDLATYCGDECPPLTNSGRRWDAKARRLAANGLRDPAAEVLALRTMPEFNKFAYHLRAWSWFATMLENEEERPGFVAFLKGIRNEVGAGEALRTATKRTTDEFDRRWADLVLGRTGARETEDPEAVAARGPSRAERRRIERPGSSRRRAALVANLTRPGNVETAELLVGLLGDPSTHLREAAVLVLSRARDADVRRYLAGPALKVEDPLALANLVRVLGLLRERVVRDDLVALLEHPYWLVRANACRALGQLLDRTAVRPILDRFRVEKSNKVKMAAMAAVAFLGGNAEMIVARIAGELGSRTWQVQVATARALADLGSMSAVDDLIIRMENSSGRVREECRDALKIITRDDLGLDPKHWREWWEKEKARAHGIPPRPEAPVRRSLGARDTVTREPTYYGFRVFSERIGFIVDLSGSMTTRFQPDPALARRLRRSEESRPRIEFVKDELTDAIRELDPRARFNIWTFDRAVRVWRGRPQAASAAGKEQALSFIRAMAPGSTTNYFDALRAALDLPEEGRPDEDFRPTPDTIYFLTDGEPTVGEITATEELLSWFLEENRFAQIRCNVIAFGEKNLALDFLKEMAESSGGSMEVLKEK